MKRTPMQRPPEDLPSSLSRLLAGGRFYDSSCSEEARVYFAELRDGYYVKRAPLGSLRAEAEMTAYFHKKGLGAEVLAYEHTECDWLVTARVEGEDGTDPRWTSEPRRLAILLGEELRRLHETDPRGCPVPDRMSGYLALVDENYARGSYDKTAFPDSFGYRSAEEAYAVLRDGRSGLRSEVLIHGDYCLPNVMLKDFRLSGFIDLGNGGVGDRHVDLFWGAWTLWFNLKTHAYRDLFLDAYGRDRVDEQLLKTVAAAEVFG